MASDASKELRELSRRLDRVAAAPIATDIVQVLADVWVDEARRVMGKDTRQLFNRTKVVSVTGTRSTAVGVVEADTPYAGYHNYGNRFTAPNRFWDLGLEKAERAAKSMDGQIETSIERMLTSGGVWNPPRQ